MATLWDAGPDGVRTTLCYCTGACRETGVCPHTGATLKPRPHPENPWQPPTSPWNQPPQKPLVPMVPAPGRERIMPPLNPPTEIVPCKACHGDGTRDGEVCDGCHGSGVHRV